PTEGDRLTLFRNIGSRSGFLKYKLVTSQRSATGLETSKKKAVVPVKIEYLLRGRHLERITTNPVDQILPKGHTALVLAIVANALEWSAAKKILDQPAPVEHPK